MVAVDPDARQVSSTTARTCPYDYLVLATGATHSYFGHDEWETHAPGLKTIEDALEIRRRVLLAFERAERVADPDDSAGDLTFVVVGGGPTGVETAGAIAEIAFKTFTSEFRAIDPNGAKVILLEGADRILGTYHESLSRQGGASTTRPRRRPSSRRDGHECRCRRRRDIHGRDPGRHGDLGRREPGLPAGGHVRRCRPIVPAG